MNQPVCTVGGKGEWEDSEEEQGGGHSQTREERSLSPTFGSHYLVQQTDLENLSLGFVRDKESGQGKKDKMG